jgi:uncharacterized protein
MTTPAQRPAVDQFTEYLSAGEIRFQRCGSCGTLRGTLRAVCPVCLSREVTWVHAANAGTIVSYFIAHERFATALETPYTVLHVELDDGVRYTAGLTATSSGAPHVGGRVRLTVGKRDGESLPLFEW